jgi:hypothetical protein
MSIKIQPQFFEPTVSINLKGLQATFGVRCKLLPIDQLDALRERWIGKPATETEPGTPPTMNDREFIETWLVGFGPDVLAEDDTPLPFNPDNLSQLLATPGAKQALIAAFFTGYEEAEAKNSEPLRAGSSSPAAA